MSNNGLAGAIPSGIGLLTKLTALLLSSNAFPASLPLSVSALTAMCDLELSSVSLLAYMPIPDYFSTFTNLQVLRVSSAHLIGTVPRWISALPALRFVPVTIVVNSRSLGRAGV